MKHQDKAKEETELEMKAKFLCQYHGQKVMKVDDSDSIYTVSMFRAFSESGNPACGESTYLLLTSLSDITDEDAIEVARVMGYDKEHGRDLVTSIEMDWVDEDDKGNGFVIHWIYACDYLRSKGYALPWLTYSVEDLISMKWIQIKK